MYGEARYADTVRYSQIQNALARVFKRSRESVKTLSREFSLLLHIKGGGGKPLSRECLNTLARAFCI